MTAFYSKPELDPLAPQTLLQECEDLKETNVFTGVIKTLFYSVRILKNKLTAEFRLNFLKFVCCTSIK